MDNKPAKQEVLPEQLKKYTSEQIALIKRTVAKGATNDELALFAHTAQKTGLDPFLKEIYFIKHEGKNGQVGNVVMMTGRDGFLKVAHNTGKLKSINSACVCANDEFEMTYGNEIEIEHKIKSLDPKERGVITGAWAEVWKEGNEKPTVVVVDFATYNKGFNTWKTHPQQMIVKVAESIALKKCFGTSGLVSVEEMGYDTEKEAEEKLAPDYQIYNAVIAKISQLIEKGDLEKAREIITNELGGNKKLEDIQKATLKQYLKQTNGGNGQPVAKPAEPPAIKPQQATEVVEGEVMEQEGTPGEEVTVEECVEMMSEAEKKANADFDAIPSAGTK